MASLGEHFYTASESERGNTAASLAYQMERTACYVYASSVIEREDSLGNRKYRIEKISCYAYAYEIPGTAPLVRLFSRQNRIHFYIIYAQEVQSAIDAHLAQLEEAACYVYDASNNVALFRLRKPHVAPIFRLFRPDTRDLYHPRCGHLAVVGRR